MRFNGIGLSILFVSVLSACGGGGGDTPVTTQPLETTSGVATAGTTGTGTADTGITGTTGTGTADTGITGTTGTGTADTGITGTTVLQEQRVQVQQIQVQPLAQIQHRPYMKHLSE